AGLINALSHESPGGLFPTQQESISLITESDQSLLPQDIEDAYNLSCLQLGMVFHSQDSPDCGMYHDVFSYHLRVANWSVEKFQIVLDALVNKHAILRTSFDLHRYSEPLQLIHTKATLPATVVDISASDCSEQNKIIADFIEFEKTVPFDLERAPLLRVFIHRRSVDTIQYTLSFHHAILDGWSVASFQTELLREYAALVTGDKTELLLTPLASAFRQAVALEKQTLKSQEARSFWTNYLAGHTVYSLPSFQEDGQSR